mmetsp:Transcript_71510/g.83186  ORF Transcript_71510/g.83186 Transcript_71510/m.83186 type:complete len:349 (-) Transcript_71510:133-1179(-)|eukprot:CAMPEP_0176408502 /NCGR_PEP_ID=MMETSP0127-20121128/1987_1 /TAXON_ID=938130 /ORGANISM="Platyophrya macrostoma, Strain WH" /LENGTH=348 /DNA_ID=CAMNT_0017787795 /DNA_START=29 /DNA_END=1075 /DNA_ORIENTATION=-
MINSIVKNCSRSLYRADWRAFATVPQTIDFSQYKTIYKRVERTNDFTFTLPTLEEKIEFNLPEEATVNDLINEVVKSSKGVKNCKAVTLDKAEIASITKLEDVKADNFYLLINNEDILKIISLDSTDAESQDKMYQKVESYCESIGVPFIERKIILNYLKRVDQHSIENFSKPLFADKNVYAEPFDKNILLDNLVEGLSNNRNQKSENEQRLYSDYHKTKQQIEELKIKRSELETQAHRRAKTKMIAGLFALFGQFSFVGVGTYVVYSWDIIEPMVYFINLAASVGLSYQFFATYRDFSHQSFLNHLKEKELQKLYVRNNFPVQELQALEDKLFVLERVIKSNIVINL